MTLLDTQPDLTRIHALIAKVPAYPVSARQLIDLAHNGGFGKEVIDFYRTFPEDEIFSSKEALIMRTDQALTLGHEPIEEDPSTLE